MSFLSDFRFDKRYYNVLEVNKTNYEQCNDREFITNITRGGRDVYQLNETRPYYFLSSGGYCYNGMKLAINVEIKPPPPASAPAKSHGSSLSSNKSVLELVFSIALAYCMLTLVAQFLKNS